MRESLFSANWHRIAQLKPQRRAHTAIHRHVFRGEEWYVLEDTATGRYHRFSPGAYFLLGQMDGERTVEQIWRIAAQHLGDDVPGQDEVIQLLAQLHGLDVVQFDVAPDAVELTERGAKQRRRMLLQTLRSPLAIRLPLWDPDRFLTATMPLARPLFSWFGFLAWVMLVAYGAVLTGLHWAEITENIVDRVLSASNIVIILIAYPFIKALHELGHGYAVKRWGGEVHELGIMLLVFMPIPYVDASAAAAYREKRKRIVVGAAGIMVELALSALALMVWLAAEPGTFVRALAFNVMLIGGVSTLLFNGNPLLRFDGYYVFSDLLEIPNLGMRSNKYIGYLIQRYLFNVANADSPVTARGESGWFVFYGIASFVYRMVIFVGIVLFVATKFFTIGILLAIWGAILMFVMPLYKTVAYLFTASRLRGRRGRALVISGLGAAAVAALVFAVPIPNNTLSQGVVWLPERSMVHAGAEGTVARIIAGPGTYVEAGDPLIEISDHLLVGRVTVLEARLREARARYAAMEIDDRVQAGVVAEEIQHVEAALAHARERAEALLLRSPRSGYFLISRAVDLPGRYVTRGELLAYIVDNGDPVVRVAIAQSDIALVRQETKRIDVRLADRLEEVHEAKLLRAVPGGANQLPSPALSTTGGGPFALDPHADTPGATLDQVFQFELALPTPQVRVSTIGGRVYVRFHHGTAPIAAQIYRAARQVFLKTFDV